MMHIAPLNLDSTCNGSNADIRSPLNACAHRAACRELLLALQLILENPDHELLPTERQTAESAVARATGRI